MPNNVNTEWILGGGMLFGGGGISQVFPPLYESLHTALQCV